MASIYEFKRPMAEQSNRKFDCLEIALISLQHQLHQIEEALVIEFPSNNSEADEA